MLQMTPDEAKRHLVELIAAALRGERVIIEDDQGHAVQLSAITPPGPSASTRARRAGTAKGKIVMSDDFDSLLPDFADCTQ